MSLPTPTGNPYPYREGHALYSIPENLAWIERIRAGGREPWPTPEEEANSDLFFRFFKRISEANHIGRMRLETRSRP